MPRKDRPLTSYVLAERLWNLAIERDGFRYRVGANEPANKQYNLATNIRQTCYRFRKQKLNAARAMYADLPGMQHEASTPYDAISISIHNGNDEPVSGSRPTEHIPPYDLVFFVPKPTGEFLDLEGNPIELDDIEPATLPSILEE